MEKVLNFYKGINTDVSPTLRDDNSYNNALNIRVITESSTSGSIVNDYGNKLLFEIPEVAISYEITNVKANAGILFSDYISAYSGSDPDKALDTLYNNIINNSTIKSIIQSGKLKVYKTYDSIRIINYEDLVITNSSNCNIVYLYPTKATPVIVGAIEIYKSLILLTAHPNYDLYGQLWKLDFDNNNNIIGLVNNKLVTTTHLIYVGRLNFKRNVPITEYTTKYWNPKFGKIYFIADKFRHINVFDSDLFGLKEDLTELSSNVNLYDIEFVRIINDGQLKNGKVQYAYQLYSYGNAETLLSKPTPLINITSSSINGFIGNFKGGDFDKVSNKGVELKISKIDKKFTHIKIYRVSYELKDVPDIHLVQDAPIYTYDNFYFIDYGNVSLGTMTPEEFVSYGGSLFEPKTLTTKDNSLIVGNIKDELFDVDEYLGEYYDARAYRFISGTNNFIINENELHTINTDSDFDTISYDNDCIVTDGIYYGYQCKYKKNSNLFGGTGKNISFEIKTKEILIDSSANEATYYHVIQNTKPNNTIDYSTYASSYESAYNVGYMWGEYYRFGIEFINKKGKRSFVKWIADVKFPDVYELPMIINSKKYLFKYDSQYNIVKALIPYITFEVKVPEQLKGFSYRIVRVQRKDIDKSVKAFGVVSQLVKVTDSNYDVVKNKYTETTNINASLPNFVTSETTLPSAYYNNKKYLKFRSPEICFKDVTINNTDRVILIGKLSYFNKNLVGYIDNDSVYYPVNNLSLSGWAIINTNHKKVVELEVSNTNYYNKEIEDVYISKDTTIDTFYLQNDTTGFSNKSYMYPDTYKYAYTKSGIGAFFSLKDNHTLSFDYKYAYVYKNKDYSRYGGVTYEAKTLNIYHPCSETIFIDSTVTNINSLQGDTFVQMFDYHDGYTISGNGEEYNLSGYTRYHSNSLIFPVYTSINTELRGDNCFTKTDNKQHIWKLQNTPDEGKALFNNTDKYNAGEYPSGFKKAYTYNNVYHQENTLIKGFSKPLIYVENIEHITKILASEKSYSGEIVDNWLKFLPNNFIELSTIYGDLNKLILLNNKILAFQDKAIAIVDYNEKQLLKGEVSELYLGMSDKFLGYDYISTISGCIHKSSIVLLDNTIYWYDGVNKTVNTFGLQGGLRILSDSLNVRSYFKNFPNDKSQQVHAYYSSKENRIYFTYYIFNISFNTLLNAFESTHSFTPFLYINSNKLDLATVGSYNSNKVYVRSNGKFTEYYGIKYPFSVEVIEGSADLKRVYTNIEFNINSNNNAIPYSIVLSNSQISSKNVILTDSNFIRRFRTYRFIIPRLDTVSRQRFVDYYLKANIIFQNKEELVRLDPIKIIYSVPMV